MGNSPLVHPALMAHLGRFHFNRFVTIAHREEGSDSFNEPTVVYKIDPLLTPIKCYKEPITGQEIRKPDSTVVIQPFKLVLAGYFPTIIVSDAGIIEGTTYNILAVDHDDTRTITVLTAEVVNGINVEY